MNELEILQLKITQLESENQSLRGELDALFAASASSLTCDLAENLIANLAQNLVDNIEIGIIVHDANTEILFANAPAADILGIMQSELAGKDISDPNWHFYHGDGRLMDLEDFPVNKILREKQVLKNYEMGLYRPDTDDMVWGMVNAYPELDCQNEIIRIVVTFTDISDLKQAETDLEKTRTFLRTMIDHLPVAVFVKDGRKDHFGEMLLWNRTSELMFGVTMKDAIGKTVYDHFPKEQADFFCQKDQESFLNNTPEDISEEPIDSLSLGRRLLHTVKIPLFDRDQNPQYLLCYSEDITERKATEKALIESEERFRQMAENIQEIFWMIDADSARFVYINPAYKKISGRTCASLYENPQSFVDSIHEDDRKKVIEISKQNFQTGWSMEYRIVKPSGEVRWLSERAVPIRNELGELQSIVGVGQDITARKFSEAQLIHQAFHDSLTGLSNRTLFIDRVEMALKKSKRIPKHLFAILFIDLDKFKTINDSLGHLIGDRLLVETAKILEKSVRSFDTVARLGGDEFAILLNDIDNTQKAIEVSERIHDHLQTEIAIEGHKILTSTSIGIVIGSGDYADANELVRDANIALYRAKEKGRASHEIFNRAMYESVISRLQLENELRQAIDREEFLVYYEPIVCLKTAILKGFEALVRWQHPTRGLLTAGEFVPLCEEMGLIVPLGRWVMQTACRQTKLWQNQFPSLNLTINVNLSGKQLKEFNIVQTINHILQETGLAPTSLNLEITETLLIENTEIAIKVFQQLREKNIHLSLDDFGTGYSSLSYLQQFPVNTIKIDRSFINQINLGEYRNDHSDRNLAIVKAIIALAHAMNIRVIAEGIETEAQMTKLQTWDCDFAQGYFFARSLPAQAAENMLEKAVHGEFQDC